MLNYKTNNEKEKTSASQTKVTKVMHDFKADELHIRKFDAIVTKAKQAIALSDDGELKKIKKISYNVERRKQSTATQF